MCTTALGSSYRWRASLPCHIPSSQHQDPPLQTLSQSALQLLLHGWKRATMLSSTACGSAFSSCNHSQHQGCMLKHDASCEVAADIDQMPSTQRMQQHEA